MKILVTSGGTKIKIDKVRHIDNMSQGTFGSKIASNFLVNGEEVIFLKRDSSKSPFTIKLDLNKIKSTHKALAEAEFIFDLYNRYKYNYSEYEYITYDDYAKKLEYIIKADKPDVIILAAAVSDYGVLNEVDGKIRSSKDMSINLFALPKLISKIKEWHPKCYLVGFKLLVDSTPEQLIDAAKNSIEKNKCDMVVANDLRDIKNNNHILHLVYKDGRIEKYESANQAKNFLPNTLISSIKKDFYHYA